MADKTWAAVRPAIVELLGTVTSIDIVTTYIPDVPVTSVHAVVLMVRGRQGQLGTFTREERHYVGILILVPIGADPEGAEDELDAVWDDLVQLSVTNVDISATVTHNTLEGYRAGWQTVGGTLCRTLRCSWGCFFAQPTPYSTSS